MTTRIAIIETDVFGVLAWHAECLECRERICFHAAHDREATARQHARAPHECINPLKKECACGTEPGSAVFNHPAAGVCEGVTS